MSFGVTIRPATLADAPAIANVQIETQQLAYRGIITDDFLDAISDQDRTLIWSEILQQPEQISFVAEIEGSGVIGFANGGPERSGREDFRGELCGLYVLPDWHGKGFGRRLVVTFANWLIDSGFDTMLVWVLADNPSRRFYQHLGGEFIGEKEIQIGQQVLGEVAYGWSDVRTLVSLRYGGGSRADP